MEDEKDAFYVAKKGGIVGVYRSLNDCQALLGSSVCDPSVSVFKGYCLPKEAEDYLVSHGLKSAVYSIGAACVQDDLFGQLAVCPFQQPASSKGKELDKISPVKRAKAGADGFSSNVSFGNKDGVSHLRRQTSQQMSVGSISKQFDCISSSDYLDQKDCHLLGSKDIYSDLGKRKLVENSPEAVAPSPKQLDCLSTPAFDKVFSSLSARSDLRDKDLNIWRTHRRQILDAEAESGSSLHFVCSPALDNVLTLHDPPLLAGSGIKDTPFRKGFQCEQSPHKKAADKHSENSDCLAVGVSNDICPVRTGTLILKTSLHVQNIMKRNEAKRSMEGHHISELRPGMLLLKRHITFNDQIKIVKACREFGLGSGGFYEPGHWNGGKRQLKMMCLGKNWDPETKKYADQRPIDGAKPPLIPSEFYQLVKGAIQDSHSFLREQSKVPNVEQVLPSMSPNICIVKFYTKNGRLGLHQDKNESIESLDRGLPVVSFSIGDSAEFLYGDQRDSEKAEKVILESGDILIFGGKSRHIFHGVTAILPNTAPKALLEETHLLPGRLNLTFREY